MGFPVAPEPEELQQLADGLTRLLHMPIKWENAGDTIRVLELHQGLWGNETTESRFGATMLPFQWLST